MDDRYSKVCMSRKMAQTVAFAILADIEAYCEDNRAQYELFLKDEKEKQESGDKNDISR